MIYLDHAATTPLLPEAREAMLEAIDGGFGNPSSLHGAGREARHLVETAREQVALAAGCAPGQVIFTGSGTESNNLAIRGFVDSFALQTPVHLVISAIEHPCLYNTAKDLDQNRKNVSVTFVKPDSDGVITPESIVEELKPETKLVSVMTVNNETGARQPVEEITEACRRQGVPFHTDACQALGRMEIEVVGRAADMMTLCAHKVYGPKGAAALIVSDEIQLKAQLLGGEQEKLRRAGTENVPAIVGFGVACLQAKEKLATWREHAQTCEVNLRDEMEELGISWHDATPEEKRIPGIWNLSVDTLTAEEVVIGLDLMQIAVSNGSACNSGSIEPSRILQAMGMQAEESRKYFRVSVGLASDPDDMQRVANALAELVKRKSAE
jgi:cysteine desulfurase